MQDVWDNYPDLFQRGPINCRGKIGVETLTGPLQIINSLRAETGVRSFLYVCRKQEFELVCGRTAVNGTG
jgi:hypothetical protein